MAFRLVRQLLSVVLAIFFSRVRRVGEGRVPQGCGLLFVANHVNSLLDPLLLLCEAPRPPRFLAKEPLFHHPLVAPFLRALRALPVYRRQDGEGDTTRNLETFAACVRALGDGEAVALFPEGRSHNEPRLQPLRTGAARIVGLALASGVRPALVPVGLHYSARGTFRGEATLLFGPPVDLSGLSFLEGDEPEAVRTLTARVADVLETLTLNAGSFEELDLLEALLPVAGDLLPLPCDPEGELALRRAFLEGFTVEREKRPAQMGALLAALRAYRSALGEDRVRDADLRCWRGSGRAFAGALPGLVLAALTYPPALFGFLFHFVPYTLAGPAARLARPEPDVLGTYKLYAGLLLYPLAYAGQAWAIAQVAGWPWAAAASAAAIPCGLWALRYYELRARALRRAWAGLILHSPRRRAELMSLRTDVLEALRPFLA